MLREEVLKKLNKMYKYTLTLECLYKSSVYNLMSERSSKYLVKNVIIYGIHLIKQNVLVFLEQDVINVVKAKVKAIAWIKLRFLVISEIIIYLKNINQLLDTLNWADD